MIEEIERFHSRGRHTCKFTETKEIVYVRKGFNSHSSSLRKDKALFSIHTAYFVTKDNKDVFSYVEA